MENKKIDYSSITAAAATVIAICSLGISVWQGIETRKHNRLSVLPHIEFGHRYNAKKSSIELDNAGIGPAVIIDYNFYLDGNQIFNDITCGPETWQQVRHALSDEMTLSTFCLRKGDMLKSGRKIEVISLETLNSDSKGHLRSLSRIRIEVRYESIYGGDELKSEYEKKDTFGQATL